MDLNVRCGLAEFAALDQQAFDNFGPGWLVAGGRSILKDCRSLSNEWYASEVCSQWFLAGSVTLDYDAGAPAAFGLTLRPVFPGDPLNTRLVLVRERSEE